MKAWASPDELSIDTQDGVGSFSDVLRDTFHVEHVLFPITRGGELALRAVFRLAASLFAAVSAACTLLWVDSKICTDCSAGVAIGILVASAFSWAVVVSESVLQMIPRYWKTHDDNAVAIFDASNWQDMDTPEGARLEPLSEEGIEVDSDCGPEPADVPPLRLTEQQVCQRSVLPVSIAPEKGGSEALPAPACSRNLPPLPKRGGGETLQKPPSFPPPSLLRGPVAMCRRSWDLKAIRALSATTLLWSPRVASPPLARPFRWCPPDRPSPFCRSLVRHLMAVTSRSSRRGTSSRSRPRSRKETSASIASLCVTQTQKVSACGSVVLVLSFCS